MTTAVFGVFKRLDEEMWPQDHALDAAGRTFPCMSTSSETQIPLDRIHSSLKLAGAMFSGGLGFQSRGGENVSKKSDTFRPYLHISLNVR